MIRRKNKPPTKSAVDYIELLYNKYAPKHDRTSVAGFIYNDDRHELDFEISSGTAENRAKYEICSKTIYS